MIIKLLIYNYLQNSIENISTKLKNYILKNILFIIIFFQKFWGMS